MLQCVLVYMCINVGVKRKVSPKRPVYFGISEWVIKESVCVPRKTLISVLSSIPFTQVNTARLL